MLARFFKGPQALESQRAGLRSVTVTLQSSGNHAARVSLKLEHQEHSTPGSKGKREEKGILKRQTQGLFATYELEDVKHTLNCDARLILTQPQGALKGS